MVIEGGEFPWLKSLSQAQMDKISQIVIEFHYPFKQDVFKKFSNHVLVHFHGNNFDNTQRVSGVLVPNVFECTFIHKKYVTEKNKNTQPVPTSLDMKNTPYRPEIMLNYSPFVSKIPHSILQVTKPIGVINGRWSIRNTFVPKS
jgi:hypothetical protein